ncbi:MAG TPA: roadblock/LC7 domain-containing protein, partial [Candidatus Thermoplasmatota archaeon]
MRGLLSRLRAINGVDGAALVSRDGLPVVADLPSTFDRETFSAMLAATVGAAETALIEAGRGVPDRIILENQGTRIMAMGVSEQFLLVVSGRGDLNL